jgi:putative endonuclease
MKQYYVYLLASKKKGTLYLGVTNDLLRRVYEHQNNLVDGFTKKYHVRNLVYFKACEDVHSAIQREKQIRNGTDSGKSILS